MPEKNTRPDVGQGNIDPAITPNVYLLNELKALQRHFGPFLSRLRVASKRLYTGIVRKRDPDAGRDPLPVPSIALTNDGRVLLSLHCIEGADISGREIWTGIVLTDAERGDVLDATAEGADDGAARVGGMLIAKTRRGKPTASGGGGQR